MKMERKNGSDVKTENVMTEIKRDVTARLRKGALRGSVTRPEAPARRARRLAPAAGILLAALCLLAGVPALRVQAGTGNASAKTKVIRTSSDEEFASETAKLAKKSLGLSVQGNGKARSYSSGRLIVRVRDGQSVDFSRYGASTVVESTFGVCIVQFPSETAAKKAAGSLASLSGVEYAEADDCTINAGDFTVREITGDGTASGAAGAAAAPAVQTSGVSGAAAYGMQGAASMDGSAPDVQEIPSENGAQSAGEAGDLRIGDRTYGQDEDLIFENSVSADALTVSAAGMSWGVSYIQADKYAAFVKANTTRTVKVAIVDTGVSAHAKIKGRLLKGKDYIDNDNNPADKNGHGTHVAGTIVDCTPGINVKVLPVRVMNASGLGNPSTVGNGIRYAVNQGAKVINLSLGGYSHYKYIEECIAYAHKMNVTVVVAAGNECENTKYICPAHLATPIVVGAINQSGKRAFFSNFGTSLDIVAPGVDIKSCWLGGGYATASGTSMAAPHISAAAAMYRLMNPTANAARIQYLVRCYAKDLGPKGTDNYYGRGVPRMAGAITPSKVALNRTSTSLQLKKTLTLKATITPSYAGKNKLTWTSSNSSVVSVSGGKLTAKKRGTATVTVKTVNGKKATCRVTVTAPAVSVSSAQALSPQDRIASAFLPAAMAPKEAPKAAASAKGAAAAAPASGAAGSGSAPAPGSAAGQTAPSGDKKAAAGETTAPQAAVTGAAAQAKAAPVPGAGEAAVPAAGSQAGTASGDGEAPAAGSTEAAAVTENADSAAKAGAAADSGALTKIYIYPVESADSAPIQDSSIVAGSRLLLAAEIVPAPGKEAAVEWSSSDPAVAAVGEDGAVTALAQGQTTITAALPAGAAAPAGGEKAPAASAGTGTFIVTIVDPSVLTRHASYEAGADGTQQMQAVLRLPGSITAGGESEEYVLALLRERDEEEAAVLLGAVNLGGGDSGSVHLHTEAGGALRTDIRTPEEAADMAGSPAGGTDAEKVREKVLSGTMTGKEQDQPGILCLESLEADGGKADAALTVQLEHVRALIAAEAGEGAGAGSADEAKEAIWKCRLAAYTLEAFEERERAAEAGDAEKVRSCDGSAVCTCRFTLSFALPDAPQGREQDADADAFDASGERDEAARREAPAAHAQVGQNGLKDQESPEDPEDTEDSEKAIDAEKAVDAEEAIDAEDGAGDLEAGDADSQDANSKDAASKDAASQDADAGASDSSAGMARQTAPDSQDAAGSAPAGGAAADIAADREEAAGENSAEESAEEKQFSEEGSLEILSEEAFAEEP